MVIVKTWSIAFESKQIILQLLHSTTIRKYYSCNGVFYRVGLLCVFLRQSRHGRRKRVKQVWIAQKHRSLQQAMITALFISTTCASSSTTVQSKVSQGETMSDGSVQQLQQELLSLQEKLEYFVIKGMAEANQDRRLLLVFPVL